MHIGILGGTGFVGKNLVAMCQAKGIEHTAGSRTLGVHATDVQNVNIWIKKHHITHVVNLAAICGGIGLNKQHPARLWYANTIISATVLEACRRASIEKLVNVGTVCSYAKDCPVPFAEDDLMQHGEPEPTNLAYGVSKLNALHGGRAYHQEYGMRICNLIPVNMYGPYDHFDLEHSHVIPAMIRKIDMAKQQNAPALKLWGTGTATREFLYVADFSEAVILALHRLEEPTFVNVGSGSEISIANLVREIASIMEYQGEIEWDNSMPDGQPRRCLSVSRAKALFGFEAKTDLHVGLQRTIDWYYSVKEKL